MFQLCYKIIHGINTILHSLNEYFRLILEFSHRFILTYKKKVEIFFFSSLSNFSISFWSMKNKPVQNLYRITIWLFHLNMDSFLYTFNICNFRSLRFGIIILDVKCSYRSSFNGRGLIALQAIRMLCEWWDAKMCSKVESAGRKKKERVRECVSEWDYRRIVIRQNCSSCCWHLVFHFAKDLVAM